MQVQHLPLLQCGQQPVSGQATSNTVVTTINIADIRTRKIVDRAFATVNDVLTYTVTIENTGNVLATNVVFKIRPNWNDFYHK